MISGLKPGNTNMDIFPPLNTGGPYAMFVGRDYELDLLKNCLKKNTASLVVCRGRRRIGKSTLIQEFAKKNKFYELYGLAPREGITNADQLRHFGELVGNFFNIPPMNFKNWNDAFSTLAGFTERGRVIILLDEISWMGSKDKDFAGKLKGIWDTKFKKNKKLILILCGSVTSWIDKNILNDKGFVGRVSLTISLDELPLSHSNAFFNNNKGISAYEKFKLFCVTGGVPRYLEEIIPTQSAEKNIQRMCFIKEGFLFSEFDKIFRDIFEKKADTFKKIVTCLAEGAAESGKIAEKTGVKPTGGFSNNLEILERSGFISRDYSWSITGKTGRRSKYRLKDNYLRFYLKYIEPVKEKIEKDLYRDIYLENMKGWETIMGLQFENLVLSNLNLLIKKLNIPPESIVSAAPYFQKKTLRKEACQVDLLIHTRYAAYICEIKYQSRIGSRVIKDINEKIIKLKLPKNLSVRPVLIYMGELSEKVKVSNIFNQYLPFEQMLT